MPQYGFQHDLQYAHQHDLQEKKNEVMYLIAARSSLYLQLGASNEQAIEHLSHRIVADPANLRHHIQRIALYMRVKNSNGVYAALIDLFIALGENGISIRQRMLRQAKPLLSTERFRLLKNTLMRGLRDTDVLPHTQAASLCKGYIGRNNFIAEVAHKSCTDSLDPRHEANDCLVYGQVDEARKILEKAVLKEPWREDLQADLLEIYWATRDLKGCQAMYRRLADEFVPERHAWIKTVERINNAVGGA